MLPDRKGNNRLDTLRNIVLDPRVALMFMIPGSGTILRVIGKAHLTTNPELLASFEEQGKPPRSVIVIKVTVMYFQCAERCFAPSFGRRLSMSSLAPCRPWRDSCGTDSWAPGGLSTARLTMKNGQVGRKNRCGSA